MRFGLLLRGISYWKLVFSSRHVLINGLRMCASRRALSKLDAGLRLCASRRSISVRDFLHRISVPCWNSNDDRAFPLDFALARKATVALNAGRFLNAVFLCFSRLGQLIHSFLNIHMTRRARADRTTRMFDIDAMINRNFKQRFTLTAHQIPFRSICTSQTSRIFQNKFHRNNGWAVFVSVALEMHEAKCRHFHDGRTVRMINPQ